jgi:hypothetical protein
LSEIATHVKSNVNKIILINVLRQEETMNVDGVKSDEVASKKSFKIKLIPKEWTGNGVLGCRIVPLD